MEPYEDLLDAREATRYLAQRWGIESYSIDAFRMLRHRYHIKPVLSSRNASFWRKSDLDKISKPNRHNPRPSRSQNSAKKKTELEAIA